MHRSWIGRARQEGSNNVKVRCLASWGLPVLQQEAQRHLLKETGQGTASEGYKTLGTPLSP